MPGSFLVPTASQSLLLLCCLLFFGCKKEKEPEEVAVFEFRSPAHFPPVIYNFRNNPLTARGFALGRKLFYDPRLSLDGTVSCGSCHAQVHAFADHGMAKSTGINGLTGTRNAPALANLAWYPTFMWDGGINHLEIMPLAPLTDSLEMGETLPRLIEKLQEDREYPALFSKVFGAEKITDQQLFYALAQFTGMMVSADAKYDRYVNGAAAFTETEEAGLVLFRSHCNSCHTAPLFTDFSFRNNGLDTVFKDPGRSRITGQESDKGKFRVPSLRNVTLTYPYMHDGRFYTLGQVLDHYTTGIRHSATMDPSLQKGIALTPEEKQQLLAFLSTLTDYTYLSDKRFSTP